MKFVTELLGQPHTDSKLKKFLDNLGQPVKTDKDASRVFLTSKKAGLEVRAEMPSGVVTAIYTYGNGHEKFGQYPSKLPHKLTFDMTLEDLQTELGPARQVGSREYVWDRDDYNISATFKKKDGLLGLLAFYT